MQMLILWCTSDPHSPWLTGSKKPPQSETTSSKEFLPISQSGHAVMNQTDEILFFFSFLFYTLHINMLTVEDKVAIGIA
jgi:hypothetical protein